MFDVFFKMLLTKKNHVDLVSTYLNQWVKDVKSDDCTVYSVSRKVPHLF